MKHLHLLFAAALLSACTQNSNFDFNKVQCTVGSDDTTSKKTHEVINETLAHEVAEYAIELKVGNPPQLIDAVIDTGSPYLVLLGENMVCPADSGAGICVGHTFSPTASSSIKVTNLNATPAYGSAIVKEGKVYKDQIGLACGQTVPDVGFIVATKGNNLRNIFGLAYNVLEGEVSNVTGINSLFLDLVQNGQMQNIFSLTLCGEQTPKGSNVEFGGIDSRVKLASITQWTPITKEDYYTIKADTLQIQGSKTSIGSFDKPVIIDSGTTFNIIPQAMFDALVAQLKAVKVPQAIPADYWESATVGHPNFLANISDEDIKQFPVIEVTVPGMPQQPGFTLQISPQTYFKEFENGKRAFGFRPASRGASYYIFGQVLMENYVVVFDRGEFPTKSGTGKIGFYPNTGLCSAGS